MTHVDLFSGIGGFALAARANGIRTVQFVEIDERCRAFLSRAWPGVPIHDDIRTFRWGMADASGSGCEHGHEPGAQACQRRAEAGNRNSVYLLTAGVPCQPASRAGKQRGTADDRWLWPEALRALAEIRPAWAVFENPPGIGDLFEYGVQLAVDADGNAVGEVGAVVDRVGRSVFDETLEAIEAKGYACRPFSVPACALDAPHQRKRYWIVCRRLADGRETGPGICREPGEGPHVPSGGGPGNAMADSASAGRGTAWRERGRGDDGEERETPERGASCGMADASECDRAGHEREASERAGRAGGGMADAGAPGRGVEGGSACAPHGGGSPEPGRCAGDVGDAEERGDGPGGAGSGEGGAEQDGDGASGAGLWSRYVWLPCADGKVRRAPDDSVGVVDGLHRSVLGALGNSVLWQLAAVVIRGIREADREEAEAMKEEEGA